MSTEPTLGELQRLIESVALAQREGLATINASLSRLVSQDVYEADQRRIYDRLEDLRGDIVEERVARIEAMAAEKSARESGDGEQQKALDKLVTGLRWTAASILIPVALFIANLVVDLGKP